MEIFLDFFKKMSFSLQSAFFFFTQTPHRSATYRRRDYGSSSDKSGKGV